jgi:hypothetical protein
VSRDVLPAEVPEIYPRWLFRSGDLQEEFLDLDAVGAGNALGVGRIRATFEAVAQVRLADAAVAEDEDLEFGVVLRAALQIRIVGADLVEDVLTGRVSIDFLRLVIEG